MCCFNSVIGNMGPPFFALGSFLQHCGLVHYLRIQHFPVNLIPQNRRACEYNYLSWGQHQVFTGCRVSSSSFPFLSYAEFPKSADKDILTVFKSFLQDFQKGVNQLGGAIIAEMEAVMDGFSDVGLD